METYEAYAEGGEHVPNPGHADLVRLVDALNHTGNTFFVVQPDDDDVPWGISVAASRGGFGGYDLGWHDTRTDDRREATAADPTTIATEILDWISQLHLQAARYH
ncbi:hypothetical protein [Promicromonospora soli]